MKISKENLIKGALIIAVMLLASLSRYIFADIPNITPILAMALFAGAMFKNNIIAYIIPVGAMIISDYFIGFHETSWVIYIAFAMIAFLGTKTNEKSILSIGTFSISSALLFFVVTNFAIWTLGAYFPMTLSGLIECYTMAIPFFRNTLLSTLAFSGILFGLSYLLNASTQTESMKVKK